MEISQMKIKKVELEAEIAEFLETTLEKLRKDTGVSIKSVSVYMLQEEIVNDAEKKYIINDVYCEVTI